jgi:hypothetical protein
MKASASLIFRIQFSGRNLLMRALADDPHEWVFFFVQHLNLFMAVVAKWLTHRFVDPTLGGSIPLDRPIIFYTALHHFVGD